MESFPRFESLFSGNRVGYQRIVGGDPDGLARRAAERLLHQAEQTTVTGVEKLARDGAASVEKFVNLLAELRFGLLFASLGARSQLLPDDAFAPAEYTPDLLVEFPSGLRMLVDAIRGSSGAPRLAEAIRERLRQKCLGFAVEHFLGYRLSVAASDHREHAASRELCQRVADQVTDEISRARTNGRTSGVFRVFEAKSSLRIDPAAELYDDVPSPPQEIWLGSFRFEPSFTGEGTAGSGATVACFVDDEKHGAKLLEKLRSKADRRVSLPHEHASTPYVIALQNDESELHPITVLSALTGRRQHLGRGIAAETEISPPRVEEARRNGWTILLKEWDYIDSPSMRLADYGAFGMGDGRWVTNVSGVLVTHNSGATVQWLPNPFADLAVRDVRLLEVGLALAKLGA